MRNRAAAIILRNRTLLVMRRQKPGRDYYILPGGGVKLDETFPEACIREVKEETGFDVLGLRLVYIYNFNGGEERYFVTRVPPEGEPVLGGAEALRHSAQDHYSFEWVDLERLEHLNLLPRAAWRICHELLQDDNGSGEKNG